MTERGLRADHWRVIATALLLMAGIQIDFNGISVVLPPMGHQLGVSSSTLEWILNAQLLAFAPPVIAIGRLADLAGQKNIAIAGAVLFAASSLLIGAQSDPGAIIALRAAQGVGSAMVCVTALSLVSLSLGPARQAVGIGIFTGGYLSFSVVAPLMAGLLAEALSWRWLFYFNGGLMVLGLACLLAFVDQKKPEITDERFDLAGFAVLTTGLLILVLGLQLVGNFGWYSLPVIGCLAGSLLLAVVFYRLQRTVKSPLVDFSLLSNRDFCGAFLVVFLGNFSFAALLFLLALYLQYVIGMSARTNGVIFIAMMIPMALLALYSGRVLQVLDRRLALCGALALMAFSFVCFGMLHPNSGLFLLIAGLLLFGAGKGLMLGVASPVAMGAVPNSKSASASGLLMFAMAIPLPLGLSLSNTLFREWEARHLGHLLSLAGRRVSDEMREEIRGLLSGSDAARDKLALLAPDIAERVHLVVDHAFAHAFRNVMFLALGISIAGMLCAFLVRAGKSAPRPAA